MKMRSALFLRAKATVGQAHASLGRSEGCRDDTDDPIVDLTNDESRHVVDLTDDFDEKLAAFMAFDEGSSAARQWIFEA